MRISDWSSDVCSSDLHSPRHKQQRGRSMDFRNVDKLNRRDMIRGAAMLGAGATLIAPLPLWAQSGTMADIRSEEHTSELQSLMRISYAVFCLKKKKNNQDKPYKH